MLDNIFLVDTEQGRVWILPKADYKLGHRFFPLPIETYTRMEGEKEGEVLFDGIDAGITDKLYFEIINNQRTEEHFKKNNPELLDEWKNNVNKRKEQ